MTNAPPTPANVVLVSVLELSVLWTFGVASAVNVGVGRVDVRMGTVDAVMSVDVGGGAIDVGC